MVSCAFLRGVERVRRERRGRIDLLMLLHLRLGERWTWLVGRDGAYENVSTEASSGTDELS